MATAQHQEPDPRYGYPIRFTIDSGETYSGYYWGESNHSDTGVAYHFLSADPALLTRYALELGDKSAREVQFTAKTLDKVTFGAAPEVGEPPNNVEFVNGHVFVKGQNIEYQIQQACGNLAPHRVDVNVTTVRDQLHFDISFDLPDSSQLARIWTVNELKRMGIWDMCTLTIGWDRNLFWFAGRALPYRKD